jgi:hypothetical protein
MPESNELKIPTPWRKWFNLGIYGVLIGLITMQQSWIHDRDRTIEELRRQNDGWLGRFIDQKLNQIEQNRLDPKINEVKNAVDSIRSEIKRP